MGKERWWWVVVGCGVADDGLEEELGLFYSFS